MKLKKGSGKTIYGPGVLIKMTGDEVAVAIDAYLVAHNIIVSGPRTITMGKKLLKDTEIYIDPSGSVIEKGIRHLGRTGLPE